MYTAHQPEVIIRASTVAMRFLCEHTLVLKLLPDGPLDLLWYHFAINIWPSIGQNLPNRCPVRHELSQVLVQNACARQQGTDTVFQLTCTGLQASCKHCGHACWSMRGPEDVAKVQLSLNLE